MPRPMKHSGVDWLGDIPVDWKTIKLKYVADFQPSCDTSKLTDDSEITYTPMEYIKNGYFINNTALFGSVAASLTPYNEGDIVMAKVTPCFENGNIAVMENLASGFGLGSSELFVFRTQSIATRYLFYWLQNYLFMQQGCATMTGTGGLKRVSPYFVRNSHVTYPPLDEQQRIANFLDDECARIDNVIEKTRASIEEYKKFKQAIITRAVTKGIRPNRTLKHSGIEWLGDIPSDWEVHQIKNDFRIFSGATPKSEIAENWDGEIIWITPADYKTADRYIFKGKRNISEVGYNSCGTTLVPSGSIIFSKRAPIGTVAIAAVELCTNQGCLSCVPKVNVNSDYYYYVMSAFTEQFNLFGTGTTFKEISYNDFRSFKVPFPPLDEQKEIAQYLDEKKAAIDSLVAKKNQLVTELESLKKSLICEYVTGKKEVAQ